MSAIVGQLRTKQAELQLSETAFAKKLGVSRTMWYLIKSDKRTPGLSFLASAMRAFPELTLEVMAVMRTQKEPTQEVAK
ncbi:MAG: helix-turn-helix transcriptional regulator [Dehalococcoidia bacterium]|jgi:DNA-binding XRE family transcriptional regulator